MNRTELSDYYNKKIELLNIQETIRQLSKYVEANTNIDAEAALCISYSLSALKRNEAERNAELSEKEEAINNTLHKIYDTKAMVAAVLHYREGNPWPVVAEILQTTEDAVKSTVYRAFKKYEI